MVSAPPVDKELMTCTTRGRRVNVARRNPSADIMHSSGSVDIGGKLTL
jgi:hypothetical protein